MVPEGYESVMAGEHGKWQAWWSEQEEADNLNPQKLKQEMALDNKHSKMIPVMYFLLHLP